MRQSQGYDSNVAFGRETTQGTAPAAGTFKSWGLLKSFEPEENKQHETIRGLGSRQAQMFKAMGFEVTSSAEFYLQNPLPLYYALGKVTKTGAANAWVHTIDSVGRCDELPTFTINNNICIGGYSFIRNYVGSKIDTLTISGSAGEAVSVEVEMVHTNVIDSAPPATSYTDSLNEPLTFADGDITIGGVKVANIKEFELEFANNLEAIYTISKGNNATMINEGVQDISGSFTFALTDTTQWTAFRNGTPFTVNLRFDDPSTPTNYFSISVYGGKYDTNSLSSESDGDIDQELDALFTRTAIIAGSKDIADLTV